MIGLGVYLFQKGQDFGLFKLAMYAQPVTTLCLAQGFAYFLFSNREAVPQAGPSTRSRSSSLCTTVSQVYYTYASLGTYGGGLTEIVKGSALGVAFTPPKNLKYDGIESDISNVVSAKMLVHVHAGDRHPLPLAQLHGQHREHRGAEVPADARPRPGAAGAPGREALPPALHAARRRS